MICQVWHFNRRWRLAFSSVEFSIHKQKSYEHIEDGILAFGLEIMFKFNFITDENVKEGSNDADKG